MTIKIMKDRFLFYLRGGSFCLGLEVVLGRNTGTGIRRLERPEQDTTNIGCRKKTTTLQTCVKAMQTNQMCPKIFYV